MIFGVNGFSWGRLLKESNSGKIVCTIISFGFIRLKRNTTQTKSSWASKRSAKSTPLSTQPNHFHFIQRIQCDRRDRFSFSMRYSYVTHTHTNKIASMRIIFDIYGFANPHNCCCGLWFSKVILVLIGYCGLTTAPSKTAITFSIHCDENVRCLNEFFVLFLNFCC